MASSRSALNFNAVASERENPRSSSTSPRVTWVTALIPLAIFSLLGCSQLLQNHFHTGFCNLKIAPIRLLATLFKCMQDIKRVADLSQIHHPIPGAFI